MPFVKNSVRVVRKPSAEDHQGFPPVKIEASPEPTSEKIQTFVPSVPKMATPRNTSRSGIRLPLSRPRRAYSPRGASGTSTRPKNWK